MTATTDRPDSYPFDDMEEMIDSSYDYKELVLPYITRGTYAVLCAGIINAARDAATKAQLDADAVQAMIPAPAAHIHNAPGIKHVDAAQTWFYAVGVLLRAHGETMRLAPGVLTTLLEDFLWACQRAVNAACGRDDDDM